MTRDPELTSPYGDNNHPLPPSKPPSDAELLRQARDRGDDLALRLAARVEALRGCMAAIKRNPSLASCQLIAVQSLKGSAQREVEREQLLCDFNDDIPATGLKG